MTVLSKPELGPICPACDSRMELRAKNETKFWGCTGYPRCKRGMRYVDQAVLDKARRVCENPLVKPKLAEKLMTLLCVNPVRAVSLILGTSTPQGTPTVQEVLRRRMGKKPRRKARVHPKTSTPRTPTQDPLEGIRFYDDEWPHEQLLYVEISEGGGDEISSTHFKHHRIKHETLNPVQSQILPHVSQNCNVVVAASTSAGKTVIAEMLMADALDRKAKAIFLSPLRAVSQEKYDDWGAEDHPWSERRIAIITGDYGLTETRKKELARANVIVMTSEMLDSYPYETEVWCHRDGRVWMDKIGRLVEENVDCEVMAYHPAGIGVRPTKITGRIRVGEREVFRVKVAGGKEVELTASHNLFVKGEDRKIHEVKLSELEPGMSVAVSCGFDTTSTESKIDLLEILMGVSGKQARTIYVSGPEIDRLLKMPTNQLVLGSETESEPTGTSRRRAAWEKRGCLPLHRLALGLAKGTVHRGGITGARLYHSKELWDTTLSIDEGMAWVLGLYLADGNVSGNHVMITQKDRAPLDQAKKVGFGGVVRKSTNGQGRDFHFLDISSVMLRHLVLTFGHGARNKRLPAFVFTWSKAVIGAFLRGYHLGDGSFVGQDGGRKVYYTSSEQLAKDVQNLLLAVSRSSSRNQTDQHMWVVTEWQKKAGSRRYPGLTFRRVNSIAPTGRRVVYDLEIQPPELPYKVENWIGGQGGLMLHNSKTRRMAKNPWLAQTLCLVVDESHLLTMEGRGDALEAGLMRFTAQNPRARIVFLSATMPNVEELGKWLTHLNGKPTVVLQSEWRPTKLTVHWMPYDARADWGSYQYNEASKRNAVLGVMRQFPKDKWLVFVHSKKAGYKFLEVLRDMDVSVEFHNADLDRQRRLSLEHRFRHEDLRVVIATSTLAYGINMPARRVAAMGIHRGMEEVEPIDLRQMMGRAGRVGLDPCGDAYMFLPMEEGRETRHYGLVAHYQKIGRIESTMNHEDTLAFHLTAEVAEGDVQTEAETVAWHDRSLAAFQGHPIHTGRGKEKLDSAFGSKGAGDVLDRLTRVGILQRSKRGLYEATGLGRVASWLYYSPFDVADWANNFRHLIEVDQLYDDDMLAWAVGCVKTAHGTYCPREHDRDLTELHFRLKEKGISRIRVPVSCLALEGMLTNVTYKGIVAMQRGIVRDIPRIMQAVALIDKHVIQILGDPYCKLLEMRLVYGCSWTEAELCRIPGIGGKKANRLVQEGDIRSLKQVAENKTLVMELLGTKTGAKAWRAAKELLED